MSKIGRLCMYPFQIALRVSFQADIGAIFWAKKILLNCLPELQHGFVNCSIMKLIIRAFYVFFKLECSPNHNSWKIITQPNKGHQG